MQLASSPAWKLRLGSRTGRTLFLPRARSSISEPQRPVILLSTCHDKPPLVSSGLVFYFLLPRQGTRNINVSSHRDHFANGATETWKIDQVPWLELPSHAICPLPWKGEPISPAPEIPQRVGTMAPASPRGARNGRHVGWAWGWRAVAPDPAKSALPLHGPRHLPAPPIRSALYSPGPRPAALALLCPRPSWRSIPFSRRTRKEVAFLAQPLTKTSLTEVPPLASCAPIGFSFRRSTRSAFSLAPDPPTFHSPSFFHSETTQEGAPLAPSLSTVAIKERRTQHAGSCRHPGRSGW